MHSAYSSPSTDDGVIPVVVSDNGRGQHFAFNIEYNYNNTAAQNLILIWLPYQRVVEWFSIVI